MEQLPSRLASGSPKKSHHVIRDLTVFTFRLSPFRHQTFRVKNETAIPHLAVGDLCHYRELCRLLREYLIQNELMGLDGTIQCDAFLKGLTNKTTTTFFELVRCFRSIVE